jgi:hypothetical protein
MVTLKEIDLWDGVLTSIPVIDKFPSPLKIKVSELCALEIMALSVPDVIPRA